MNLNWRFLYSEMGMLQMLQLLVGAAFIILTAVSGFHGLVYFALFTSAFFCLTTLILLFLRLLYEYSWRVNEIHDMLAAALYVALMVIMVIQMLDQSFCNIEDYPLPCAYNVFLGASVCSGFCSCLYLLSAWW
ncbi:PREDICTED: MARVEL domain-containing protein 1-like [Chrysochloris asiatica]|uniref:MARVEL domain-containing protein 1-like n=1 Tax=Chrysochloris asiatica TaxID=185453 RepID=A0A9B0UEZ8_CHRAS|nr:PREDICTED: MARVEL domain-containing protein 1-like [Chrysochloris asiatica]